MGHVSVTNTMETQQCIPFALMTHICRCE